ncbi:MAG: VOC family protein [Acidimicrobiia bacterium]
MGTAPGGFQEINAVTLAVADMDDPSSSTTTSGSPSSPAAPGTPFTTLRAGRSFLNLQLVEGWAPPDEVWGRVIFWVDDVDAVYDRAVAHGWAPEFAPTDAPWGERYFHLRDPDGHECSFARRLDA